MVDCHSLVHGRTTLRRTDYLPLIGGSPTCVAAVLSAVGQSSVFNQRVKFTVLCFFCQEGEVTPKPTPYYIVHTLHHNPHTLRDCRSDPHKNNRTACRCQLLSRSQKHSYQFLKGNRYYFLPRKSDT